MTPLHVPVTCPLVCATLMEYRFDIFYYSNSTLHERQSQTFVVALSGVIHALSMSLPTTRPSEKTGAMQY